MTPPTAVVQSWTTGYRRAEISLTIDQHEHERRASFRHRSITDPSALDLLLALPTGETVPWRSLTRGQQVAARIAPDSALVIHDDLVTRHAVRPARLDVATVRFPTACQAALESAGRFAPFCARQVVVTHRPTMTETLIEFGFWGIGLLLDHGHGDLETLVAPEPWVLKRHTVAGWRFVEQVYGQYVSDTE